MNDSEIILLAIPDTSVVGFLVVKQDLALVAAVCVDAGKDLHQRRLARTVLSAQTMDLATLHTEADIVQRAHAGKVLGDVLKLDDEVVAAHAAFFCLLPPRYAAACL